MITDRYLGSGWAVPLRPDPRTGEPTVGEPTDGVFKPAGKGL